MNSLDRAEYGKKPLLKFSPCPVEPIRHQEMSVPLAQSSLNHGSETLAYLNL